MKNGDTLWFQNNSHALLAAGSQSWHLPFTDIFFKQKHWHVWELVVTNKNSSYVANEVMLKATCRKMKFTAV